MNYRIRYIYDNQENFVYYQDASSFSEILEYARYIHTKLDKCPTFIQIENCQELPL